MLTVVDVGVVRACVTIVIAFLLVIMFIVATVANSLIVLLFVRRRGMRTLPNRFVLNLSIINLVSACGLLPLLLADMFLPASSTSLCHTVDAVATFVVSSSVLATLLVAGDRYAAVTDALRYHTIVTKPRSLAAIVGCWVVGLLVTVPAPLVPAADKRWETCLQYHSDGGLARWYAPVLAAVMFAVPLAALVWMYVHIYRCAHKNSERQRRNSLGVSPGDLTAPIMGGCRPMRTQSLRVQSLRNSSSFIVSNLKHKISNASLFMYREEGRTAKVSFVVVVMFFACWLPFFLSQVAGAFITFSPSVAHAAGLLAISNSAISPFIYSFRSRRTQRELKRLFGMRVTACGPRVVRPLRRTFTNPTTFPLMDTIQASPLETSGLPFPAAKRVSSSFLFTLARKSSSVPSVQAALLQPAARTQLFTFPETERVEVTAASCGLPRGSISSESSDVSQQSNCTVQTDASGH